MFWLSMVLFCVVLGGLVLRPERKQALVLGGLMGMLMSGLLSAIPITQPCVLTDNGPLSEHWTLLLLSQVGVAPILSAWYAQDLAPCKAPPLGRTAAFGALSSSLSMMALAAERINCPRPIAPLLITGYHLVTYLLIWKTLNFVHACGSPDRKGDRSVRVR